MNMLATIVAKSDQINADDFGPGETMDITIRDVRFGEGAEQPVSIYFEGNDKAFRPCKSMRRVIVAIWGPDAKEYVGRSMRLYNDPEVTYGKLKVGGIRISHMTNMQAPIVLALTATRANKKPFKVEPMQVAASTPQKGRQTAEEWAAEHIAAVEVADSVEALDSLQRGAEKALGKLATGKPDLHTQVMTAYATKLDALNIPDADDDEVIDADGVVVEDGA